MPEPASSALEHALTALAERIEYPPTPTLVPAVTARLTTERESGTRPPFPSLALWTRRRTLAAVAIGLLALLAIAAAARLTIGALEIRVQPNVTPASSTPTVAPGDLGPASTLAEAEADVGFRVALPGGPRPDEVYEAKDLTGAPGIVVAWRPGGEYPTIPGSKWSLVLMVFPGDAEVALKTIDRFGALVETTVAGAPASWIGAPHLISFQTEDGTRGPYRVLGNVLIWETAEGLTYRMETALPRAEAVALAQSLR
jgi:hypothetical protein